MTFTPEHDRLWKSACLGFANGKSAFLADLARHPVWVPRLGVWASHTTIQPPPPPQNAPNQALRTLMRLVEDMECVNNQMKLLLGEKVVGW